MTNKRIKKKKHKQLQQKLSKLFENVKDEDIIHVNKDGVVQLDFNNPKHIEFYKRWITD